MHYGGQSHVLHKVPVVANYESVDFAAQVPRLLTRRANRQPQNG
jgi:hypothetical protein